MRINHNISAMVGHNALFRVGNDMNKSLEKLSTGLRINRSADDAAGLAISENLRTQVRGTSQAKRNAQDGIAVMNVAEGAANEIHEVLQRMRELAVQSANDTLTTTERGYTNQEFSALINEIERIAQVTNYNNMKLIADVSGGATVRFGSGSVGSSLWIDANDVYGNDSITVTVDTLTANSNGLNLVGQVLTTQSGSVTAITNIDRAINSVNQLRSDLGAAVNRLEHAIGNLSVSNTNQQAAESLIRDVDFAYETTRFTRNQILVQSATAMLAQANLAPQSVLQLLG